MSISSEMFQNLGLDCRCHWRCCIFTDSCPNRGKRMSSSGDSEFLARLYPMSPFSR